MNLLLAIETSSDEYQVVIGHNREAIFISNRYFSYPPSVDLPNLVSHGLKLINASVSDIKGLTLNIGPGGLTSIRVGASFVNALAFSLGIKIYPFNYFEIIAKQSRTSTELPILCAVPAANNHAYVGLINNGYVEILRYGLLPSAIQEISKNYTEIAVAGKIRHRLVSLLDGIKIIDTDIERPDAKELLELGYQVYENAESAVDQVSPINEQSEIFYE